MIWRISTIIPRAHIGLGAVAALALSLAGCSFHARGEWRSGSGNRTQTAGSEQPQQTPAQSSRRGSRDVHRVTVRTRTPGGEAPPAPAAPAPAPVVVTPTPTAPAPVPEAPAAAPAPAAPAPVATTPAPGAGPASAVTGSGNGFGRRNRRDQATQPTTGQASTPSNTPEPAPSAPVDDPNVSPEKVKNEPHVSPAATGTHRRRRLANDPNEGNKGPASRGQAAQDDSGGSKVRSRR